ncbi:PREDICTED: uncharacterized protein LOC109334749 isoform X3 [Lupinus angustifolius]|uniref:uncharacterized protein LOC109334749 isoform X3 n=1 Tax=Lupinus angustifolius TaxID=3871 RepID=UPI00092E40B8|nr:PREDICTED: uncharacterized protein LOC109334749 isoform X3 [Lupinus angustifolius]
MAYRRRQNNLSTFEDFSQQEIPNPNPDPVVPSSSNLPNEIDTSSSSLAAKAIRASSARCDSSLSSLYGHSNLSSNAPQLNLPQPTPMSREDSRSYEFTSLKSLNQTKNGFWGVLARKAKSIVEDDNATRHSEMPAISRSHLPGVASREKEGFTIVENRTSDIIQETRKHIRKKPGNSVGQNQEINHSTTSQQSQLRTQMPPVQTDQDLQLKASRDVAMAMATKAKLLLRELKTVKADLAFAKDRCAQLEEENKILRENRERGDNQEDDDLIRLQLETLLAEKARLAHENSVYARENCFLRDVVEYHQLTMQDVVYLDENNEEVTEVNPHNFHPVAILAPDSITPSITSISSLSPEINRCMDSELTRGISHPSGKDAKSSEVTRSISSVTGKGAK